MYIRMFLLYFIIASLCFLVQHCLGSVGDRLRSYQSCFALAYAQNCTKSHKQSFYSNQSWSDWLTLWSCEDECKYQCMWSTVSNLTLHGYAVPQFHGKWPFVRLLGMQEPASVIFSLLNMAAFCYLFTAVKALNVSTPLRCLWLGYSALGIFTWIWSAVFHSRDTQLTEKLDYFCAFASVMYGFYAAFARIFLMQASKVYWHSIFVSCVSFYVYHIYKLGFIHFDYGYNMLMNVAFGAVSSLLWLVWSCYLYLKCGFRHVQYCAFVVVLANVFLLLELNDFPPLFWTFDAHSIWHLLTSPLPLLWARFVTADCQILLQMKQVKTE